MKWIRLWLIWITFSSCANFAASRLLHQRTEQSDTEKLAHEEAYDYASATDNEKPDGSIMSTSEQHIDERDLRGGGRRGGGFLGNSRGNAFPDWTDPPNVIKRGFLAPGVSPTSRPPTSAPIDTSPPRPPTGEPTNTPTASPTLAPIDTTPPRPPTGEPTNTPTASPGPLVDIRYEGMKLGDPSESIPPDPIGAAGPFSLIAVVNSHIQALDKDNGSILWENPLAVMFRSRGRPFDPKIVYDDHEDRFVVVALDFDRNDLDYSSILLAVSIDDNPASIDNWYTYEIDSLTTVNNQDTWADYPGFEVDEEAIYITNRMFTLEGAYQQSRLWIVDKGVVGGFYDGGNATVVADIAIPGTGFDLPVLRPIVYMPAEIRASNPAGAGTGVGTYLVGYDRLMSGIVEVLTVIRIDDPLGSPNLVLYEVNVGDIDDRSLPLPKAPQPDIVDKIEVNSRRVLDAVWLDDELWCVFTVDRNGRSSAYWVKMDTSSSPPVVIGQGILNGDNLVDFPGSDTFTYFPSVAVNTRGIAAFGFCASASDLYAGAYVAVRDDVNDDPGALQGWDVVREGVAPYIRTGSGDEPRNRWGDYTGISIDPSDEDCFWVYNQYAAPNGACSAPFVGDGCWATAWARLCVRQ